LVELTCRAVSCPDGTPQLAKAQLFLTVDIDDLKNEVKAGTTIGGADAGTVLAPQTVRRIACDAGLLPTVMAGTGQVLDLGTTTRCFTPAQTKALWLRDHARTIPAAECRRSGVTRIIWSTGETAAVPTSTTGSCSAAITIGRPTIGVSWVISPPRDASSGT
jgi:hypothetical protein